jgi:hypothetical protein
VNQSGFLSQGRRVSATKFLERRQEGEEQQEEKEQEEEQEEEEQDEGNGDRLLSSKCRSKVCDNKPEL